MNSGNQNTGTIEFKGLGDNDQVKYEKADMVKAGRIGGNFAISFFQMDYQALVNALTGTSSINPADTKLLPVAKVVLDADGFNRLRNEVNTLWENVYNQRPKS